VCGADGNLRFSLNSFLGVEFVTLLKQMTVRRHGALHARKHVLLYFTKSEFVRTPTSNKTPNALGERFNVLLEPAKVPAKSNSLGAKVRQTSFQVEADAQGMAAGDAIENITTVLIRAHKGLETSDIYPPSYLPYHMRQLIRQADAQPPFNTFLRLGGEWEKLGVAEFDYVRDM
jgi:hypothetical protein